MLLFGDGLREVKLIWLTEKYNFFVSYSLRFFLCLPFHPVLKMPLPRKRKQRSKIEAEKEIKLHELPLTQKC